MKKVLLLLIVWVTTSLSAQENRKLILDLSGTDWKIEGALPEQGIKNLFHKHLPDCNYAKVPGDVFTDLWRIGRIDEMNTFPKLWWASKSGFSSTGWILRVMSI